MAKWLVNYDGWLVVEADTEQQADVVATKILSNCAIPNDGAVGEWYTLNAEREEDNV